MLMARINYWAAQNYAVRLGFELGLVTGPGADAAAPNSVGKYLGRFGRKLLRRLCRATERIPYY
jgi:hypothetical protein